MPSTNSRINSIIEIIGAFFVDIFHIRLYSKAKSIYNTKEDSSSSISAIYTSCVIEYSRNANDSFNDIMKNMQKYFQKHTNDNIMTLNQVYNELINVYIPSDLLSALSDVKKTQLIKFLITRIVRDFSVRITKTENMKLIIDMRNESSSVRPLQDCIINDVLLPLRDDFYHEISNRLVNGGKSQEARSGNSVDAEVVKKIRGEKERIKGQLTERTKEVEFLKSKIRELGEKFKELQNAKGDTEGNNTEEVERLREKVNETSDLNRTLREENGQLVAKVKNLEFKVEEHRKEIEELNSKEYNSDDNFNNSIEEE